VVLRYDGDRIEPLIVLLERVAGKTRHMPDDFFAGSNAVSDEGRRYFRRLLPKLPDPANLAVSHWTGSVSIHGTDSAMLLRAPK
jgi:hypothetical protein